MRIIAALFLSTIACTCLAGQAAVENVRMWPAPDRTRIVFDINGPLEHTLFVLNNPPRVVVDLRDTSLGVKVGRPTDADKLLERIRHASRNHRDLRVVFDLRKPVRPRSFLLKPNKQYGYRLVVDLYDKGDVTKSLKETIKRSAPPSPSKLRDLIIAIDAGHGGEDPGTIGRKGTREKDVVLAIAKELNQQIKNAPGMRPVMVRRGDYYVGLRRRMKIAREHRADLFVSIHADSFKDPRVRGSSVYVLSRNGASSEAARWLAEQENAADLVGGVSLDDKDNLLASVLLDLSQTATLSASTDVGTNVLKQLGTTGKTHKRRVQRAGFMVLKSPDIPSILVETAFLSNPSEEKRLRNRAQQRKIAKAMVAGVKDYFKHNAPPGTRLAGRSHTITRGDTLGAIAGYYGVSLRNLRKANALKGSDIKIGQVLEIPTFSGG
ncbi:MAG: N-acetylmuramoyl-L-alanine amidase [Gammaproteobacteria bacterium]|nr:N-acetylmuramoyl-L-alanine amidase [Gammaproteobacteria bacterium]MDX2462192.1 N-acetylmuramoyl-L-alanine amidase [Gammaproteobacteria bacterium]